MEATIRTKNKNLFEALLLFLKTLHISVETKEKIVIRSKSQSSKALNLNTFSFYKSIKATKGIKGSLSDTLLGERRSE